MQDKEKRCNDCREIKKREDFAVRTASRDGLQRKCRQCDSQYRNQVLQLRNLEDSEGRPVFTPELLEKVSRIMMDPEELES